MEFCDAWLVARQLPMIVSASDSFSQITCVDHDRIDIAVDSVLSRLHVNKVTDPNKANIPLVHSKSVRANILLVGGVLEQLRSDDRDNWPDWAWGAFYNAIADIADGSDILEPPIIMESGETSGSYFDRIRQELNPALIGRGQEEVPGSPMAAARIDGVIATLRNKWQGDFSRIMYGPSGVPDIFCAIEALREFSEALPSDSMAPVCLKLCFRHEVWAGYIPDFFPYPFAKTLAVYLLDEGIAVTNAKVVDLDIPVNKNIFRSAVNNLVERAEFLITSTATDIIQPIRDHFQSLPRDTAHWWLSDEIDFAIWSESVRRSKAAEFETWRLDSDGRAVQK